MIFYVSFITLFFSIIRAEDATSQVPDLSRLPIGILNETRRILKGREVSPGTRPYMVYLKPVLPPEDPAITPTWLCGGVIIHEHYILTSAACIESLGQFHVISGTHSWTGDAYDECVKNGGNMAVWKCVLKNYKYDGKEFDNINWMNHDIAVVQVQDRFDFRRRVRGCDFVTAPIAYNNRTEDKEKSNTMASVAGWGSTSKFGDPVVDVRAEASANLLETDVRIISKKACKRRWPERYHSLIDAMICTQDVVDHDTICADKVNCKEMADSFDQYDDDNRRHALKPSGEVQVHSAHDHTLGSRRRLDHIGGFCENDHGGPLIVGQGKTAMVVGIISACQVQDITRKCHGPFLYTSVYKNRDLISCAIYKEYESNTCRRAMRDGGVMMVRTSFIRPKTGRSGKKSMAGIGNPNDDSDLSSSGDKGDIHASAAKIDLNTTTKGSAPKSANPKTGAV